jgi:hypothetical protein
MEHIIIIIIIIIIMYTVLLPIRWPHDLSCSLAEIAGSNPARGHGCVSVVSTVCFQVEVSATG